jgi:hypothetical protein
LVALVAPTLEVPVLSQHAIASEIRQILHGHSGREQRVHVVTVDDEPSVGSASKLRKEPAGSVPRDATGLDEALAIASGVKRGASVDPYADAFVYAYISEAPRRDPFRCSPVQRDILSALASGTVVSTSSALARAVHTTPKEVNKRIAELADALAPRLPGDPDAARDGHERVHLLVHHYGPWIRLRDSRRPRNRP